MKSAPANPDVAVFFGRPGRSDILAEKLKANGFHVVLYNNRGSHGRYVPLAHSLFPVAFRVLSTRHQIYFTPLSFIPSLCLCLNRLLRGSPCVLNATGLKSATYGDRSKRWPFRRLAERWFYPAVLEWIMHHAGWIVCNSRYLQRRLESEFPRYAHKMSTIYNGIEFDRFASPRCRSIDRVLPEPPKLVAVMTWNYKGKADGAKLLIDAMSLVTRRHPDARLTIAAKIAHQRYADEIESYLATKTWQHSIKILYNQENIPKLLASSDVFVYATRDESNDSLPRAMLEAHAAGLPIVSTATSGCPEIVEDAVTGFLVPYQEEPLAQRVIELLENPDQAYAMGKRGRERIQRIFNWDSMAEQYADLFRRVMIAHPARSERAAG